MERHAKSLKSPLKTCSFAPRISRIYPSAKGDEDLIPWVGIIGVAFCQKILRFYNLCSFFFHWDLEESGDSGLPVACWDTQLPKGKIRFFSAEESTVLARFICNNRISNSLCYDKVSGGNFWVKIHWSKGGFQTTLNFQDENLPATLWFHHYPESPGSRDDVWNHLENGPQHKSKGYLSLFQAWFVGRRVKNCPITIKQNQGRAINGSMTTCLALPQYFRHLVFLARVWEKPFRILRWWGCNQPCRWSFSSTKS